MTNNKIKVLIVDDNSDDIYLITELLNDIDIIRFELLHEKSLDSALKHIDKEKFDCVILDLNLLDSSGTDTLKAVLNRCPELPIVVLTVLDDEDIAIESLQDGAQDYLVKGKINGEIISRSIRYAIERKKTENGLRRSEKKYKNIVDTILEGLWMIDIDGRTTYVNKQLAEMLGYTSEEILNQPFFNFVDKPLQNDAKQFFERRKKGIKDRYDFRFIKKDGSILWVIVSATPIFDEKGKFAGAMGLLTDITEHKLTEQSLEKSVHEWNSTFNAITDIVCTIDSKGRITRCNSAAKELFKRPNEEIIGKTCWEVLNCSSESLKKCPIINMQKTCKRETLILQINGKWFHSSVDPIVDNNNKIIGGVHIISDITEYKLAQNELREREESYRTIIEHSNDMIWTLNTECNFLFFNKRTEKITGHRLDDWKNKNFSPLIIKEDLPKVMDVLHNTLNGQPDQYEATIKSKYGKDIIVSVNTAPIYSKGKIVGTVNFGRDITDNKKSEEKIKKTTEELARSNKELEQFAYIASHDLQEPLRSISSFTELLTHRYKNKLGTDADEFIEYILDGTRHMQEMINDLLILSRVGTKGKEFKPTYISNILGDVLKTLHSMIERNNAIITIDEMPIVDTDSSQLFQLFQNLIDNAIKFRRKEPPHIHVSAKQEFTKEGGCEWIFSVHDNGIGIAKRDVDKLFVIFQRLHNREEYPGTGIGLAICKKIVTRHGGRIWVESKFGEGSTFYFTIPIIRNNNRDNNK